METIAPSERERFRPSARAMVTYLNERIPQTRTVLLCVTGLSVMAQIRTTKALAWLETDIPDLEKNWVAWADSTEALAPARSDLTIPLLSEMAAQGQADLLDQRVRNILERNSADPVGLYFLGLLTVLRPEAESKSAGLSLLRDSVHAGIERFMPLAPSLQQLLAREQAVGGKGAIGRF